MAASSQYSLICWSKMQTMFTILLVITSKLMLLDVLNFDVLTIMSCTIYNLRYNLNFGHTYGTL